MASFQLIHGCLVALVFALIASACCRLYLRLSTSDARCFVFVSSSTDQKLCIPTSPRCCIAARRMLGRTRCAHDARNECMSRGKFKLCVMIVMMDAIGQ